MIKLHSPKLNAPKLMPRKMKLNSPKQQQGNHYETLAKRHLEAQGLTFFAKNWHHKNIGELDLVMIDDREQLPSLVIVEVRQRNMSNFGTGLDSITPSKQRKIIKATQAFLQCHEQFVDYDVRFDVVVFHGSINGSTINGSTIKDEQVPLIWLQSAFIA